MAANANAMLSPTELIACRVTALQRGDYGAIYATYHAEAPFRSLFPALQHYLDFATEQLADRLIMRECLVVREEAVATETWLLLRQHYSFAGSEQRQLEVVRCRQQDGDWTYHSACQIDESLLSGDPLALSWDELLAAGSGLWI